MYSKEEEKALKLEFWRKLGNRTRKIPGQRGKIKVWIGDRTQIKGVDLRFDVSRKKIVVALEINIKHESRRLALYEKLEATKKIFETEFGESLTWDFAYEKEYGEEVCRVYKEMDGDFMIPEQWPAIFTFMIDNMLKMEKAFLEVKDFLKYDELGQ
ncbi:DUF4268 domain-containing protein [Saccharicrinis fermentans]|uniref:DUF4268 domain-containing protein n=1 Tax=Saccharicrinis fermentans DSM 9555 = JCM 21142 TaxID=869213 RepID=W7YSB2_9BACT|nr:DUF4268 domain-containing protein [Saccharicrinis fermentans]GAF05349.1 hypothetical protein JCM21142_104081 [Saccharicrinis fermentans DSM 9555 = JCM 21142]